MIQNKNKILLDHTVYRLMSILMQPLTGTEYFLWINRLHGNG